MGFLEWEQVQSEARTMGDWVEVWTHQSSLRVPWLGLDRCAEAAHYRAGKPLQRDALDRTRDADIPGEGIRALVSLCEKPEGSSPSGAPLPQGNSQQKGSTSVKSTSFPVISW